MAFFLDAHDKFDKTFGTTKAGITVSAKCCKVSKGEFSVKPTFQVKQKNGEVSQETTLDFPHDTSVKYDGSKVTLTSKATIDSTKVTLAGNATKCGKNPHATLSVSASPIHPVSTKIKSVFFKGGETVKVTHQHLVRATDFITLSAGFEHTLNSHKFLGAAATFKKDSVHAEVSVKSSKAVTLSAFTGASLVGRKATIGAKITPASDFKSVASYTVGLSSKCGDAGKFALAMENCNKVRVGFKNNNKVDFGYTVDCAGGCSDLTHSIGVKVTL